MRRLLCAMRFLIAILLILLSWVGLAPIILSFGVGRDWSRIRCSIGGASLVRFLGAPSTRWVIYLTIRWGRYLFRYLFLFRPLGVSGVPGSDATTDLLAEREPRPSISEKSAPSGEADDSRPPSLEFTSTLLDRP